jgi:hypothetical protein
VNVSAIAWPHDGIAPVELWDVRVGGGTLFAQRDAPAFYALLVKAVLALRAGTAERAGGARLPPCAWDTVALVGGALDESRARDAFDAAGIALDVVAADPFFAASHAREALAELGPEHLDSVVIDVGQTAIKGSGRATRIHRRRAAEAAADPRAELVGAVASVLVEACAGARPSFVLFALPCEVEARDGGGLALGASTYPTQGDGVLLAGDILERAAYANAPSAIVNDAILAAWALARRAPAPARARLVLTLGLGVGAAVIARVPVL